MHLSRAVVVDVALCWKDGNTDMVMMGNAERRVGEIGGFAPHMKSKSSMRYMSKGSQSKLWVRRSARHDVSSGAAQRIIIIAAWQCTHLDRALLPIEENCLRFFAEQLPKLQCVGLLCQRHGCDRCRCRDRCRWALLDLRAPHWIQVSLTSVYREFCYFAALRFQ